MPYNRLLIISNRLPVVISKENEEWNIQHGKGGLVTAMAPVLKNRGGVWIGWPGVTTEDGLSRDKLDSLLSSAVRDTGYHLKPVLLTEHEKECFYEGFANELIWPLFHDLPSICNFDPEYWHVYKDVNRKFAENIVDISEPSDFIWVHDYHLMNTAMELRERGVKNNLGFFLHIPFPPLDIFLKLPWRKKLLRAILQYDLIGFQTPRDRRNFLQCVKMLLKGEAKVRGKGTIRDVYYEGRNIRVGSFPISIDYRAFDDTAETKEVADRAWFLHENLPNTKIILGVDRLDYTKGIPFKLDAFERALKKYPDMRRKVSLIQILVPSRTHIPKYNELKETVERMVGRINGEFSELGWVPIYYIFRNNTREQLLAYYRTAEIALVTPLKDGMNLVAKEFCAASVDENSTLILSEFAGAAAQLGKESILVNPYDVEKMADAIYQAVTMGDNEKEKNMRKMRQGIRNYDIFWWVDSFLKAAISKPLDEFIPHREFDFDY